MRKMKHLLLLCILFLIASCAAKNDNHYFQTDVIEITHYTLPDSAKLFDTIKIEAKAQEPNHCWYNLNFVLSKYSDSVYRLKAFGSFETFTGVCLTDSIFKDTIINFIPIKKGKILFYITQPTTAVIDTLVVN
jgi:hypothetical protein